MLRLVTPHSLNIVYSNPIPGPCEGGSGVGMFISAGECQVSIEWYIKCAAGAEHSF